MIFDTGSPRIALRKEQQTRAVQRRRLIYTIINMDLDTNIVWFSNTIVRGHVNDSSIGNNDHVDDDSDDASDGHSFLLF